MHMHCKQIQTGQDTISKNLNIPLASTVLVIEWKLPVYSIATAVFILAVLPT